MQTVRQRCPSRAAGVMTGLSRMALIAFASLPVHAAVAPATFDEYVGIAWYTSQGADLSQAESVSLSVDLAQTDDRGHGSGEATTSSVLPLPSELDLWLFGGTNPSGIGGTAFTQTWYQFSLDPMAEGLPDVVPITLTASGWVLVESSLADGLVGLTFARIDYPSGQLQATNEDASGGHNGRFSFDRSVPLNVMAGVAQTVSIYLYSHGQGAGEAFFHHGHAYLDPLVEIDAGFPFKDQYQIVYGQGIAAAIPEPSSVAMLTAGLGLLGLVFAVHRQTQAG